MKCDHSPVDRFDRQVCKHCGKLLKPVKCPACAGSGYKDYTYGMGDGAKCPMCHSGVLIWIER